MDVYSGQTLIASNDNWGTLSSADKATITARGLQPTNNLESALVLTLNPGDYTVHLKGHNNSTGVGLVGIFDVDGDNPTYLTNISTRGDVGTGGHVMIGGFIISGTQAKQVVVSSMGPSLTGFGVPNALSDTVIEVYSGQTLIASNDNWGALSSADKAVLTTKKLQPTDNLESALVLTLNPGPYTVHLKGYNNSMGVGLVAVYDCEKW